MWALAVTAALAATPVVHLDYHAPSACPTGADLERAVRIRLGREAFDPTAAGVVEVVVASTPLGLEGRVVRRDERGLEVGQRTLKSTSSDCGELFGALELAVAIAIEPRAGLVRPPQALAPPAEEKVRAESPPSVVVRGLAGLAAVAGTGPTPSGAVQVGVAVGVRSFELTLALRGEWPTAMKLSPGQLQTQLLSAQLAPCVAIGLFRGCAHVTGGALRVTTSGLAMAVATLAPWLSAGLSAALEFAVGKGVAVRPFFEGGVAVLATQVRVDDSVVFASAPVHAALGVCVMLGGP